jgi:hypothetical protein
MKNNRGLVKLLLIGAISVSEAAQLEVKSMSQALAEAEAEARIIAQEEAQLEIEDKIEEEGESKFIEIVTDREKALLQEDSDIDQGIDLLKSKQVEVAQKLIADSTQGNVDEYGVVHSSLEPIESLV